MDQPICSRCLASSRTCVLKIRESFCFACPWCGLPQASEALWILPLGTLLIISSSDLYTGQIVESRAELPTLLDHWMSFAQKGGYSCVLNVPDATTRWHRIYLNGQPTDFLEPLFSGDPFPVRYVQEFYLDQAG